MTELKTVLKRIAGVVEFRVHRCTALPKGWKSKMDPKSGRTIFYKANEKTLWSFQHPLAASAALPAPLSERKAGQQPSTLEMMAGAGPGKREKNNPLWA